MRPQHLSPVFTSTWVCPVQRRQDLVPPWLWPCIPNSQFLVNFPNTTLLFSGSSHKTSSCWGVRLLTGSLYIWMMSCFTPYRVGWAHGEGSSQWRFRSNPIREHLGNPQSQSQYKQNKSSCSLIKTQLGVETVLSLTWHLFFCQRHF